MKETNTAPWWYVYLQWRHTGKRETIRTKLPGLLYRSDDVTVLACLIEARMSVQPAERRRIGRQ
jgi:hypothetical protein